MLLELENHLNSKYQDVTNYVIKKSQTSNNFIKEINKYLNYSVNNAKFDKRDIGKLERMTLLNIQNIISFTNNLHTMHLIPYFILVFKTKNPRIICTADCSRTLYFVL